MGGSTIYDQWSYTLWWRALPPRVRTVHSYSGAPPADWWFDWHGDDDRKHWAKAFGETSHRAHIRAFGKIRHQIHGWRSERWMYVWLVEVLDLRGIPGGEVTTIVAAGQAASLTLAKWECDRARVRACAAWGVPWRRHREYED